MEQAGQSARERAAALARRWPREIADSAVLSALHDRPLVVACSGGADSVALLLWLAAHYPSAVLRVVHVDHCLRGAESDADAAFVETLASALGLGCAVEKVQITSISEASLRSARLEALRRSAPPEGAIVFGHHADDVLENLLFRTFRGGSLSSLAGLRPVQPFDDHHPPHVRPLLGRRRDEIREVLREVGQDWREDGSNAGTEFTRNRLRHQVVPALHAVFEDRDLAAAALNLHREVGEIDQWMDGLVERALESVGPSDRELPLSPTHDWPSALRRRLVVSWLQRHGLPAPRREVLEQLVNAAPHQSASWNLDPLWRVEVAGESLRLHENASAKLFSAEKQATFTLTAGASLMLPDGGVLKAVRRALSPEENTRVRQGAVNPSQEAFLRLEMTDDASVEVRAWQPGDRYHPLGAPGTRKLQDCFTDRRIPESRRHQLPVVVSKNGEILWVPGLEPAHDRRLEAGTTRALWLTYHRA